MEYIILQLKADTEEQRSKWFMPYSELTRKFGKVDLNDYFKVYEGEIDAVGTIEALDNIFDMFNTDHPKDFKGHSLSVSDIVVLEGGLGTWYCDGFTWNYVSDTDIREESMWDRLYRLMSYLEKRPNGAAVELEQKDYDFFTKIGFVSEDGYISFHGKRFCLG